MRIAPFISDSERYALGLETRNCREQGAHHPGLLGLVVGLAADLGLRATRRLHSGTGRALLLGRALNDGAAGARARRAGANLAGLITRADAWRAGGDSGLQDVLGHIRRCGALRFEHVATHVGLGRARRDAGLQHVLGPVNLGAAVAVTIVTSIAALTAALTAAIILWLAAHLTR
jgi:hypothetical protein